MLKESHSTRQFPNEPIRRWFTGSALDLIIWYEENEEIVGFQLCYNKGMNEHALTWWEGKGFSHTRIDDGEGLPDSQKMTPILLPDGAFDKEEVLTLFRQEGAGIDPELISFVTGKVYGFRQ